MYSPRFNRFIEWMLLWETEFSRGHYGDYNYAVTEKDPDDKGNYWNGKLLGTKFGIDAASFGGDPSNLTKADATKIYWNDYWQRNDCEKYNQPLGEVICDISVNNGAGKVHQWMAKSGEDAGKLLEERINFYKRIAKGKKAKYLRGWVARSKNLAQEYNIKIDP